MPEIERYIHGVPCWVDVNSADPEATAAFYSGLGSPAEPEPLPDPVGLHGGAGLPGRPAPVPLLARSRVDQHGVDADSRASAAGLWRRRKPDPVLMP